MGELNMNGTYTDVTYAMKYRQIDRNNELWIRYILYIAV